jgi:hypothetical protein
MWLWEVQLYDLGFRRRSERYWSCARRFGLPDAAHVSIFSWSEQTIPDGRFLVELTEFHITYEIGLDNVHFYFHERADNIWRPGGHTWFPHIKRLGVNPIKLRKKARRSAGELIAALNGVMCGRREH